MIIQLTEKHGKKYSFDPWGNEEWVLPRTEWLLQRAKDIEIKLLAWYKEKENQGDNYYVAINSQGKWVVGYTNDYPMQHGNGKEHIISESEFYSIMKKNNGKEN
jgi:hypothetical protein